MNTKARRWPGLYWLLTILLLAGLTLTGLLAAQGRPAPPDTIFDTLAFRGIGPATMGGRIDDLAVLETKPAVFYVAAATGGLWKTINNGTTWEPLFTNQDVVSIGDIATPPDDASLVWVGTGENNNRQSSSWGGGVYKSTDGGRNWKNMGLADSRHIGRIVIDPVDHDVVYVAAMGHLWGPNPERGVFKTTDGGLTWRRALFVDENTGATDLVMDPLNNKIVYTATYQRQRASWGYNGGGPGSGIYKSVDAGSTWVRLTGGLPEGPLGRIGLDIYRRSPTVVYALVQHEKESGVYRSDNGGENWTKMSDTNPRPLYFSQIRIDPNDDRRIYVLGVRLMVSGDGGKTFVETRIRPVPGGDRPRDDLDLHALWVDPADSGHLVAGSDVGVAISWDRGLTWDFIDNLPIGQFYHVGYDMDTPYRVYGGMQDNDVWGGPSAVRSQWGITNADWFSLVIGDGFAAVADPRDSRTVYGETQGGNLARVDRGTYERATIKPQALKGEPPLRWSWDTPLLISPHDPDTIFIAANKVFKSTDRGQSWKAISADLTSQVDRETLSLMGVAGRAIRISKNDGVSAYPAIVAFTESPKRGGLYYAGAEDGTVHLSRDAGNAWTNISDRFPAAVKSAYVSRLTASAFDEGTVYAAFDNHRQDDNSPYVFVSTDYGNSWKSIVSNLPAGQAVNFLTEDARNPNVLYLGTEFGLFVSLDRGGRWIRIRSNLPTVPVDEITLHPRDNDMILATHGRSLWILDDVTPIQQAAEALQHEAFLFDTRAARQFIPANDRANYPGDRRFWGRNPEFGAGLTYYLAQAAGDVSLVVRDAHGAVVQEIAAGSPKEAKKATVSRVYWNLRYQSLPPARGRGQAGGRSNGPFVPPGDYRVTLKVDGREVATRPVVVTGDPLIRATDADRKIQHETALALHELQRAAGEAADAVAAMTEQMKVVQDLVKTEAIRSRSLDSTMADLGRRLDDLRRDLGAAAVGQIGTLKAQVMASTSVPTDVQMRGLDDAREALARVIATANDLIATTMPQLYKVLEENGRKPATLTPLQPVRSAASGVH